jgi:hypothetical protein
VTQTFPALLSVRRLSSTGEGSGECLHLWELLECSICDPRVGVRPGPPVICASFCDMVFEACSEAYFSVDTKTQVDTISEAMRVILLEFVSCNYIQIIWNFIYSGTSLWNHDMCLYMELLWLISIEFMLAGMCT